MELSTEIKESSIMLLIVPKEKYNPSIIDIAKSVKLNSSRVCYVCVNNPYSFVASRLSKAGLGPENFFFIDTLTKSVQEPQPVKDCIFVSAPNALTEISLAFSKAFAEMKCDSAIFDTLSAFLIYENPHTIIQFIHNILTKIKISAGKAVFVALKEDINSELVKDLYMFVDKVVEI